MKPVMHQLNNFFSTNRLHFERLYDPNNMPKDPKRSFEFDSRLNEHIANEMRWWLQTMHEKYKRSPGTLYCYCLTLKYLGKLLIDKYPDTKTIVELEHDALFSEFCELLVMNGCPIDVALSDTYHITGNMRTKEYTVKSDHIYYFDKYYSFVHDYYYPDNILEKDKDLWDIRNLGIPYHILSSRPRYTINYSKIYQPVLKDAIKSYNLIRIPKQSISTVLDDMKAFNMLSEYLLNEDIEINTISDINRGVITGYIKDLRKHDLESTTFNRRISAIKTFLSLGYAFGLEDFPPKCPVKNSDFKKVVKKLPDTLSDRELKEINKHLNDLPYPFNYILFIIERHGLRASDLCAARIYVEGEYCIKRIGQDNNLFTYYQIKTHKTNTICLDDVNAEIIKACIEQTTNRFGTDAKYIFAKSKDQPVTTEAFVVHLNKMSYENNIMDDNGQPLRIKGHVFRRTLATDYANMGIDLNVIKSLLGQSNLGVLSHYVKIHSEEMISYINPIIQENYNLIENIGKSKVSTVEEIKNEGEYLALSCGYCKKSVKTGICDHANACYGCTMFKPLKSMLPLYKKQLSDVELSIFVCNANGYERLLETNLQLKDKLVTIIQLLESENENENGQNSQTVS